MAPASRPAAVDFDCGERKRIYTSQGALRAEGRFTVRHGPTQSRRIDVHPDGDRFAVATVADTRSGVTHDHVTLIFNLFDELRRIAPMARR